MHFRLPGIDRISYLRNFLPLFLLLALVGFCPPTLAQVHDLTNPEKKADLLVKFSAAAAPDQKAEALKNSDRSETISRGVARQADSGTSVQAVRLAPGVDLTSELARISKTPGVAYVEPNYRIKIENSAAVPVIPNDFNFSGMYALKNIGGGTAKTNADIHATEAWAYTTGSSNVIVAVIDTGVDYFHEDLRGNIWHNAAEIPGNGIDDDGNGYVDDVIGYDFVSGDSDPFDDNNHGTHVSGTIGAVGNNGVGTVGVCWQVSLMELKAFDDAGNGSVEDAIKAIEYAVANGARIINASWGLEEKSKALEEAVQKATDAGVLFVAAAGNNKTDTPSYPAAFKSVVSVAATDDKDTRAPFSNYGNWVSVSAPGMNILSTLPENNYGIESGTSMAAPHVSGVAGLILSRFPDYRGEELRQVLINSVDPISSDKPMGNGRINAALAVRMDQPLPYCALSIADQSSGILDVIGSAYGRFFTGYSLRAANRNAPLDWVQIASSNGPVTNSVLGQFNTSLLPDGDTVLQLVVTNLNGNTALFTKDTKISNTSITSPLSGDIIPPGSYQVKGTVFSDGGTYELSYGAGLAPATWVRINSGNVSSIQNSVLGEWNGWDLTNGYYSLKLVVSNGTKRVETKAEGIFVENELKPGWPVHLNTELDFPSTEWRNIRVADLDGDGVSEFVMVDPATLEKPQTLLVYSLSGELKWTREIGYDLTPDLPVIGDLYGDGKLEIIVDGPNGIIGFHSDGSPMTNGWPIITASRNHGKVLADLDRDGTPELITFAQENPLGQVPDSRELAVYKMDGSLVRKWDLPYCGFTNQVQNILPAVANLDDEPGLEIVAVSGCSQIAAFDYRSAEPKWRANTSGAILSSPVIGDVDGNGSPDVVVATAAEDGYQQGGIYIFNNKGELWPGWPMLEDNSFLISPALGDLDKDGRLEIVVPSSAPESMHVVQWDGFEADGWPKDMFYKSNPRVGISIANIDSDAESEIIMVAPGYPLLSVLLNDLSYSGGISAWKFSGDQVRLPGNGPIDTLPIEITPIPEWHKAAPGTIGDFDGDGILDFVATSLQEITLGEDVAFKNRSSIYAWSLNIPVPLEPIEWPMLAHDLGNTGFYSLPLHANPGPTNLTLAVRDRQLCKEDHPLVLHPLSNDLNATTQPLQISGLTQPLHGTAYQNGTNLIYFPESNYRGPDSFTYTIRDVVGGTSTGKVTLIVKAVNDPPTAEDIDVTMIKNSSADIVFKGSDPDGDKINFRVVTGPAHGELWNYPNVATYYPQKGFSGTDSFTYVANDGQFDSALATVSFTIINSNNPPTVVDQSVLTKRNRPVSIAPQSNDIDNDPVTFEITSAPLHGTAEVKSNALVYRPASNYLGNDTLRFRGFDGTAYSAEATISISIIATNAAPLAQDFTRKVQPNTATVVKFNGSDPDGDAIVYKILSSPLHGRILGTTGPSFLYVPMKDYEGPDRITYSVNDGVLESRVATAELSIIRENRAPKGENQSISVNTGASSPLRLKLVDDDGDPLDTIILKGPVKGLIYGTGTNLLYLPNPGALGEDHFTYKAWDGQKFGNVTTVALYISPDSSPEAPSLDSLTVEASRVQIHLTVPGLKPFRLESSTNLIDWSPISSTITPNTFSFLFTDTNTPAARQYYRARQDN